MHTRSARAVDVPDRECLRGFLTPPPSLRGSVEEVGGAATVPRVEDDNYNFEIVCNFNLEKITEILTL